jgi:hypothetical protein
MTDWKNEREVLVAIDIVFSNAGIYPPLMKEVQKGQWVGEVDDGEVLVFEWRDGYLLGIIYDGVELRNTFALGNCVGEIHREFLRKKNEIRVESITPDRVFIFGSGEI